MITIKEEKREIIRIKEDIIALRNEFDTMISEINNAIKQVADHIRVNPHQTCIQEMKKDISDLKTKYNTLYDFLIKIKKR